MCCFSRPVSQVGGTRIFARQLGGRQALAYSMNIELDEATAMVLPAQVRADRIDAQEVELGFAVVPSRDQMDAIERELSSLVAKALA